MLRHILTILFFSVVITACASSSLSKEELDRVKNRVIGSPYELTYNAAVETVRSQQFTISVNDRAEGRIEGHHEFSRDIERRGEYFIGYDPRAATALYVEATVVRVDDNNTRIEFNLIEEVPNRSGSSYQAQQNEHIKRPVREPEFYNTLFQDLQLRLN
ncbi:MAG: hypothetical protein ACNA8K_05610 [Cyclonatronaceae bacterium]